MTVLRSGSASDVGRVRTVNEDRALEAVSLFAVADGMGGHVGGEIAARTAIETLESGFARAPTAEGLVGAVQEANRVVWEAGHADPALRGMGTTLISAGLVGTGDGDRLVITNVGDSRGYRLRDGQLTQLTVDHSVAEELVARGELSEEEAAVHPHRHILTRALGVGPDVDVDVWEVVPEEGDRFILCSDGLTNEVPEGRIAEVLSETPDPREVAGTLVEMANRAGGNDNITVVVLDVVVGERAAGDGSATTSTVAAGTDGARHRGTGGEPDDRAVAGASGAVVATVGPGASGPSAGGTAGAGMATALAAPPGTVAGTTTTVPAAAGGDSGGVGVVGGTAPPTVERAVPRHRPGPVTRPPRRVTFRVVLFLVLLGGVVYGGYALIHWYVDSSYFVSLDHGRIVIYQGRRGGFVGIEPKIVKRYDLTTADVPSFDVPPLRAGVEQPSLRAAENYVTGLENEPCILQGASPTCGSGATTTTAPVSSSTTAAPSIRGPRSATTALMAAA